MRNQGDVHIWKIQKLPRSAKRKKGSTVRDGEATGHAHRLHGTFQLYEDGDRILAHVLGDGAVLKHEEHKAIALKPGIYEFGPTHMYDYETEESRILAD